MLSQFVEEEYALELLSAGVEGLGYLLKERVSQLDELVRALHDVSRGGSALDPKVVEGLLSRRSADARSPLLGLTDREREVLAEMATGRNNAMIAKTLFMSDRAVEKHIGSVFQKLRPRRRGRGQPSRHGGPALPRGDRRLIAPTLWGRAERAAADQPTSMWTSDGGAGARRACTGSARLSPVRRLSR